MDFAALAAPFPPAAVSWRVGSVTKDGTKGMALAYIDARDVMRRLDEVCGPAGWSDRYEIHGTRTLCLLSIKVGEEWITKTDGAGDSDIEAEKGSLSDAFKRSAVKWGIGRYLYDIDSPWVAIENKRIKPEEQSKLLRALEGKGAPAVAPKAEPPKGQKPPPKNDWQMPPRPAEIPVPVVNGLADWTEWGSMFATVIARAKSGPELAEWKKLNKLTFPAMATGWSAGYERLMKRLEDRERDLGIANPLAA